MPSNTENTKVVVISLVKQLSELLIERSWTVTTAESCTGGLVAAALTDIAGSSAWFHQGVVSYANHAKVQLLDVDDGLIQQCGAVSKEVVKAMATGALARAQADVSIAISGVAGPGGGTQDKPVGTVWIGWALSREKVQAARFLLNGDRVSVREAALIEALRGTIRLVRSA